MEHNTEIQEYVKDLNLIIKEKNIEISDLKQERLNLLEDCENWRKASDDQTLLINSLKDIVADQRIRIVNIKENINLFTVLTIMILSVAVVEFYIIITN
jgi:hypothetical protein